MAVPSHTDARAEAIEHAAAGGHDPPVVSAAAADDTLRGFVIAAVGTAAAVLLAVLALNVAVDPYGSVGSGVFPTAIPDDAAIKVALLDRLRRPPQLVVLGSSRSLKADPQYLRSLTGLRGFNAGVRGGTAVEAYALARYVHDRWPAARPRFLLMLDVESFRWDTPQTTLLDTPQLARYVPAGERARQRLASIPRLLSWQATDDSLRVLRAEATGAASPGQRLAADRRNQFRADGYLIRDSYDPAYEARKYRDIYRNGSFSQLEPTPLRYLREAVAMMDRWGTPPLIVLTPIQPTLQAELDRMGWRARQRDLVAALAALHRSYRFTLADMTTLSSFGGMPWAFYDHVHMRPVNMRRMLDAVIREHPAALQ